MERLHINYAKIGYKATNKKAYIKQMTQWLTRQEKIHRFTAYLQWVVPGYRTAFPDPPEARNEHDNLPNDLVSSENTTMRHNTLNLNLPEIGWSIPKTPSYQNVSLKTVQDDFGAIDVVPCIEMYLRRLGWPVPHVTAANLKFMLYKRMYVWIPASPQVSEQPTKDVIIATCPETANSSG